MSTFELTLTASIKESTTNYCLWNNLFLTLLLDLFVIKTKLGTTNEGTHVSNLSTPAWQVSDFASASGCFPHRREESRVSDQREQET